MSVGEKINGTYDRTARFALDGSQPALQFDGNSNLTLPAPRFADEHSRARACSAPRVRRAPPVQPRRNGFGLLWLAACLLLAGWLGLRPHPSTQATTRSAIAASPTASHGREHFATPIEDIRVGQRVLADNPLATVQDRLAPEPDERTWRHLKLRMTKADGCRLDIELPRSIDWISRVGAQVGGGHSNGTGPIDSFRPAIPTRGQSNGKKKSCHVGIGEL